MCGLFVFVVNFGIFGGEVGVFEVECVYFVFGVVVVEDVVGYVRVFVL